MFEKQRLYLYGVGYARHHAACDGLLDDILYFFDIGLDSSSDNGTMAGGIVAQWFGISLYPEGAVQCAS